MLKTDIEAKTDLNIIYTFPEFHLLIITEYGLCSAVEHNTDIFLVFNFSPRQLKPQCKHLLTRDIQQKVLDKSPSSDI